jgi:hypothetical protein
MKQEMKWGAAAVVAVVAAVGISSRTSGVPRETASAGRQAGQGSVQSKAGKKGTHDPCEDLVDLFQDFLLTKVAMGPKECYVPGDPPAPSIIGFRPKVVIATFPDPLHTHFALLFDRFVEAIQEGAQDEGYDYDSSWLPWETEEPTLTHLSDQDKSDDRTEARERQPGVLLFRSGSPKDQKNPRAPYKEGLIVFVVGEEPTSGIHRKQFENAVAWITALRAQGNESAAVTILGPTFSGSFPSLTELLSDNDVYEGLGVNPLLINWLAVYSGSASGKSEVEQFNNIPGIVFHSFLQDDDTNLDRFCRYLEAKGPDGVPTFDIAKLAVLSEDETAYGSYTSDSPEQTKTASPCIDKATWLYYPRDISTLRAAYQDQSIFSSGSSTQQNQDAQRKGLSTDLADPAGKEHDTVRSYAGNQIPLSQEAQLLGIVAALRAHRAQYVIIRSSNTLDPLFLTNFLRRDYPEARVVILNADLLFQRGQDALELSGAMTVSTYPLFPWEREWTASSPDFAHSHRVFPESSTEGTYIASRLLLQSPTFGDPPGCTLWGSEVFVPSLYCHATPVPIPDYAPPFWTQPVQCKAGEPNESCKPATWLSVITKNGSWPLAVLNDHTLPITGAHQPTGEPASGSPTSTPTRHLRWPSMPLTMKLFLLLLFGLAFFHLWCCRYASFTAKPAFRAHFATCNWRHRALMLMGSFLIALMALITGWGCGAFAPTPGLFPNLGEAPNLVFMVWVIAGVSLVSNLFVTRKLSAADWRYARSCGLAVLYAIVFGLLIWASFHSSVGRLENVLMLGNRVLVYWRSMNLVSGVSPIAPFLSLILGLYVWFWYALHGLALFGPDRPRLPSGEKLILSVRDSDELHILRMFSEECAATPAEHAATPLAWFPLALGAILFFALLKVVDLVVGDVPVRSLGGRTYASIFCLWLDFCVSLVIADVWQLLRSWGRLRQLLVFLDRMTLRRTLGALHGFDWGSVWKMSGNVLDVRYKLASRQIECLTHLYASLQEAINSDPDMDNGQLKRVDDCLSAVKQNRDYDVVKLAVWYSENYRKAEAVDLQVFEEFQKQIAATSGLMLTHLLVPAWQKEEHSLILSEPGESDQDKRKQFSLESVKEHIRNAEELVCLTYLGFAQNMLGRIRTIVMGALCLFVTLTLAVSSYPFDPRPALSGVLLVLFVGFGAVVILVYAGMHRDATLSHVTNTNPGELGSEFWFKLIGFGAAPVLGLITAVFPELPGSLLSWLQPGLTSLK